MSKNCPRVGLVMPLASQQGGAEALLRHLLRERSGRFRLSCAFLQNGPLVDEARSLGYEVHIFPTTRLTSVPNYLRTVLRIRRWVRQMELDAVLSWMTKAQLYVAPASFGLPLRVAWFQHGLPADNALDQLATRLPADGILCCSHSSRSYQDLMVPKRRTFVVYPGISLPPSDAPSPAQARQRLHLPASTPLIGMVARLENWKGAHVLVDAAELVFVRYPQAIFFIVGGSHPLDPGYAASLKRKIETLSRPSQFRLVGQRTMEETSTWQLAADVIAHPVTGIEAFGMAVPEAMARGKAVVASNEGGPAEVIQDNVNGVLVPKNNPQELARALIALLDDPLRRSRLEAQALLRASAFSIPNFVRQLDETLAELTGCAGRTILS
jgi:glycosyltransferase involved in cell wall biosynthesis